MRRENRRNTEGEPDFKRAIYISGSVLAITIIAFIITFWVYGNKTRQKLSLARIDTSMEEGYRGNTEATSSQMGKTVTEMSNKISNQMENIISNEISNNILNNVTNNESNITKYAVNTSNIEGSKTNTNQNTSSVLTGSNTKPTNTTTKKEETKPADPKFKKPVEGEVIREFAQEKLVYSNTLEEWITHNGIDIKANKTTVVKASEAGTVKSIKNDPRYGLTVTIEHVNGFTSIYSNLLTAEFVVEGEKIKQGQTIGTVGNTATFEISDDAHLHFEITKDGNHIDPELYIKK